VTNTATRNRCSFAGKKQYRHMSDENKKCPVCNNAVTRKMFSATVRCHYQAKYRLCEQCQFLYIESPQWLEEAYEVPINVSDTGIMARSLGLSRITSVLLYFLFNKKGKFLDYAGGYGIFTRLMRDIGFDFYWYDPYSENLMARGFELVEGMSDFELLTCFETLEHLQEPMKEIEKMRGFSDSILCTTTLLPASIPEPGDWDYYGLDHGQHISFYSFETLLFIAKKFGCNLYSNRKDIHMFTKRTLNPVCFRLLLKLSYYGLFLYVKKRSRSKTNEDSKSNVSLSSRTSHENTL
jgi:hypothetical protein